MIMQWDIPRDARVLVRPRRPVVVLGEMRQFVSSRDDVVVWNVCQRKSAPLPSRHGPERLHLVGEVLEIRGGERRGLRSEVYLCLFGRDGITARLGFALVAGHLFGHVVDVVLALEVARLVGGVARREGDSWHEIFGGGLESHRHL